MQMNDLQKELDRTKIALMRTKEAVFFTTIVFSLKFKWDDTCPTAWTDGYTIGFNPQFFLQMPIEERVGVLVHEANHVAYDHMGRVMERDRRLWNIAADHVINLMLLERGFKLPSFRLADERFKGMSTEQVYTILLQEQDQTPNQMDDLREPGSGTDGDKKPIDPAAHCRHIENVIIRAANQSRMAKEAPGAIPGEVEVFLKRLLKPELPWTQILRREVAQKAKVMYSWLRPNRRFFPDVYLPSLGGYAPVKLRFYVDISGSVSDHQFIVFISEMVGALKMLKLEEITIVQFDTRIKSIDTVRSLRELSKIKFTGRGGTDPECIFDDIDKYPGALACIFTDGEFEWYRDSIKGRILWLINDNKGFEPRFGRAIHFSTRGKNQ